MLKITLSTKKFSLLFFISLLLLFAYSYNRVSLFTYKNNNSNSIPNSKKVVLYKDPSCTCCGGYASYLRKNGFSVEVVKVSNLNAIKKEKNVPWAVQSCHTAVFNDEYVIEGHVPLEAVNKLLAERPSVLGIALPGMPTGSPGMGGFKKEPFKIYTFNSSSNYELFTTL